MEWWQFAWAVLNCAAAIAVPGSFIAMSLRLRGLWFAGATAGLGVSTIAIATLLASALGLRFSLWVVLIVAALLSVAVALVGRVVPLDRQHTVATPSWRWAPVVSIALGILLLGVRVATVLGSPSAFAQVGDNVYHLNAARHIADGGSASPLGFAILGDSAGPAGLYPTAWHAITALTIDLAGVPVTVATNATLAVVSCVVWPIAAVLLVRTLFGGATALLVAAGVVSAGFASFPLYLIPYMGVFPLLGSIPLVAIVLAGTCALCGVGAGRLALWPAGCLVAGSLPGLAAMHPSAAIMLSVLALPGIAVAASRLTRRSTAESRRLAVLLIILASAIVLALALLSRPFEAQERSWRGTIAQSVGEVLLHSPGGAGISFAIAAATIFGIVLAIRREDPAGRVAVSMWALVGLIYVGAAGDDEFLRLFLANPWYSDATRVAGFLPIVSLPLAALGVCGVWRWGIRTTESGSRHVSRGMRAAIAVGSVTLLAGLTVYSPSVRSVDTWARSIYVPTDDPLISAVAVGPDEREVLSEVAKVVPPGDLIAGHPRDGSNFAYALTGRRVLFSAPTSNIPPTKQAFLDGFSTAQDSDPACAAARDLGVKWVLEFHPDKLLPNVPRYDGLQNLDDSPNVELAFRSGSSSLYKVVGCGIG